MKSPQSGIKAGYKQTDVGIIPEDWDFISYGDAFSFLSTAAYSRSELSSDKDILYVHYGDIHTKLNGFLDLNSVELPSIDAKKAKKYSHLAEGDLLIADASEDYEGICKSVEVKNLGDRKAIAGLHTFLLRDSKKVFTDGFRGYIRSYRAVKSQIEKFATGLKVYGVSKTNLKLVLIPLPPVPEQQAIAEVLSDVDALVASLDQLITKKRNIKQGTVQLLLTGKERLSDYRGNWSDELLPKICWYQEGPGLRQWQFTKEGIKVINVTNLENGYLNLDRTDRHISIQEFNNMYQHFEIDEGDIVVASSGNSYCKVAVVREQDLPLVMNTSVIRFKPLKSLDYDFLLAFLNSIYFKEQIDLLITGGAQPNFGPAHLKKVTIPLPPTIEEQKAIAQILSDMDAEIEALEKKREKYKAIKQGMMQELLTGRTRLI